MPPPLLIKDEPGCRIWIERPPEGGAPGVVVKMYRRRGLWGGLRAACGGGRARREFAALARLAAHGVPCPAPLAWGRGVGGGNGCYETITTREIPGAAALEALLKSGSAPAAAEILGPLFAAVAAMHRAGVYHGALGPKNVLIAPAAGGGAPAALALADFARARLFAASIHGRRIATLDLAALIAKLERHLGTGACRPHLAAYGLPARIMERVGAEAVGYGRLGRSERRKRLRIAAAVLWAALRTGKGG